MLEINRRHKNKFRVEINTLWIYTIIIFLPAFLSCFLQNIFKYVFIFFSHDSGGRASGSFLQRKTQMMHQTQKAWVKNPVDICAGYSSYLNGVFGFVMPESLAMLNLLCSTLLEQHLPACFAFCYPSTLVPACLPTCWLACLPVSFLFLFITSLDT